MKTEAEIIEAEFDILFDNLSYQRVDKLISKTPDFPNADYINKRKTIIVELKVLDKDFFKDGGVIESLQTIVTVPKKINKDGTGQYTFKLPKKNRNGIHDILEEPLRRILKKANKQIKETNSRLLESKGKGFLVLAINMETSIDPTFIQQLTFNMLKKEFTSIDGVVFCTPKTGINRGDGIQPICLHCNDSHLTGEEFLEFKKIISGWCDFVDNGGHAK